MREIELRISARSFLLYQSCLVAALLLLSLCAHIIQELSVNDVVIALSGVFDVGRENSIPTWFSSLNIALSAMLTLLIAIDLSRLDQVLRFYWLSLAILLLCLSLDEIAMIHERTSSLNRIVGLRLPLPTHGWLIYGTIFTFVVALSFVPFMRRVPRHTAFFLFLSGAVFVAGALGFEFLGALMLHLELAERVDFIYKFRRLFEEGCEMYGIVILNFCLLREYAPGRIHFTVDVQRRD